MEILEVSPEDYANVLPTPYHVFGSVSFCELNRAKCESVHYLLFRDSKYRLGLIGGIRDKVFLSPFSAPFGGFSPLNDDVKIHQIDAALELWGEWAAKKGYRTLKLILPPPVYQESFGAKQANSLYRHEFSLSVFDLNYAFHLDQLDENYAGLIWRNARKNLQNALNNNLGFSHCKTEKEKSLAFDIIRRNREQRGFPLRMNWEQVQETILVIPSDFFLVHTKNREPVAAALVFHVHKEIVQVIYWGDLPDYAGLKTMNFLSFKVFEYYKHAGKRIVDIGPSTENSEPNHGLCEFKESIGCSITPKLSFTKHLNAL